MKIKDVMTKSADWISPDTTLAQAAQQMKKEDIGFLPVGENDKLIGSVTDRDIAIRAVAEGKDPNATKVREVMTAKMYYCFDDQSVDEICDNMAEIKVRRLPVVNRDKRLVGVVSLGDLSQAKEKSSGEALKTITQAPPAQKKAA
jgi:CBS domain-containing protein